MAKKINMIGYQTGKLIVIGEAPSKYGQSMWLCQCECGNTCEHTGGSLRRNKVKSCGCVYRDKEERRKIAHRSIAKTKHGDCESRLYFVWLDIRRRCDSEYDISYPNYGGRGIKVCDEWNNDYLSFKEWAIANGYDENAKRGECTIDRIDVNGDYTPENCRWITMKEQCKNKRNTVRIIHNGEDKTISEWSEITGISRSVIYARYRYGWSSDEIFSPINQRRKRNSHHQKREARFPRKINRTHAVH